MSKIIGKSFIPRTNDEFVGVDPADPPPWVHLWPVSHYLVFADNFFCAKKTKKILIAKLFRNNVVYYVRRLSVSYRMNEDITKNAWRTPLNAQCNIDYRLHNIVISIIDCNILYSLLF